ncbi:MAG: MotA/TolQ/ExbB proton channel family protein [Novosphingobium sp.]
MDIESLLHAPSAAVVIGGTVFATFLRCGAESSRLSLAAVARLCRRRFDAERARAELAVQVREIQSEGLFRAHPRHFGDSEFDEATDALIGQRSIAALVSAHEAHKARRIEADNRATATLSQAAELAPVFGMVGTMVSLSQLPAGGAAMEVWSGAISMAVLSTLYGLLLANLLLAPLARILHRAALREEAERQQVVDWLTAQVTRGISRSAFGRLDEAA